MIIIMIIMIVIIIINQSMKQINKSFVLDSPGADCLTAFQQGRLVSVQRARLLMIIVGDVEHEGLGTTSECFNGCHGMCEW